MAALTTSPLAGSRAHCKQLGDLLFESSQLSADDRIPPSLRRNPKMFFEIFEKERNKHRVIGGEAAAPATAAAGTLVARAGAGDLPPHPAARPAQPATEAVNTSAAGAALPLEDLPRHTALEDAPPRALIKVVYCKDGLMVKTKRIALATSYTEMLDSLRAAFEISSKYIIKLACDDGQDLCS